MRACPEIGVDATDGNASESDDSAVEDAPALSQHHHNTTNSDQCKIKQQCNVFFGELLRPAHRLSHSLTAAPIVAQKKKWVAATYVVGPDWPKLVGEVPLQQAVSPVFLYIAPPCTI